MQKWLVSFPRLGFTEAITVEADKKYEALKKASIKLGLQGRYNMASLCDEVSAHRVGVTAGRPRKV